MAFSKMSSILSILNESEEERKKRIERQIKQTRQRRESDAIDKANEETKKYNSRNAGLFDAGAFKDGYEIGDVTKTILGTAGDIGVGLVEGVAGIGEGIGDALLFGAAKVGDLFGADTEKIKEAATDEFFAPIFSDVREKTGIDDSSLLGHMGRGVTQGIGQVGTVIATGGLATGAGAGVVGTTAATTGLMGASSFGSGTAEAYKAGATDEEAYSYGAIKAAVDAGSELIFGGLGKGLNAVGIGKGLSSADDMFAKALSRKLSNRFLANTVEWGVKASAEGLEEVLAGIGSAAAKKLTYMSEEDWGKLLEDENLFEQFAVGAITSGIAQGGDLVSSTKSGRDFVTNLTKNEQKVVDAEVKNRVEEAEKDGKKVSKKERNEIEYKVIDDLKKGYISTDTIESVLGGDTYKSYKDALSEEEAVLNEFKALGKTQNPTLEQSARYAELQQKVKDINEKPKSKELGMNLSKEVQGMLTRKVGKDGKTTQTDDYLLESYNEKARRGQKFEADLSQYDEKQAESIKNAIDSGILNNTRRTHEFVDMIAKVSSDKGVSFDFSNNEKLKESGFAIEGRTVNGVKTKDGVTINIQSAKALDTVVGHEITHVLEGTELYNALAKSIVEYSKTKGEYQNRYDAVKKLYEGVKDADVDAELVADLVGDYLFSDADFVNHLYTTDRNVFQKIFDEIKYLCKVATAGSKEARELEKVKRAFENAYKIETKKKENTADGGVKYSLSEKSIDKYTEKQYNDFGWARFAGGITYNELNDMYSKIQENGGFKGFHKSTIGESIIEVNDNPKTTLGVDNVFVYVTGTKNRPQISKVVRFQVETDDEMVLIKEKLYEKGSFSNSYYWFLEQYGFAREYSKKSAITYFEYQEEVRRRSGRTESVRTYENRGVEQNGSGTFEQTQPSEIEQIKEASSSDGVFFDEVKKSISSEADTPTRYGNVYGKDIAFESAPIEVAENAENIAPVMTESEMNELMGDTAFDDLKSEQSTLEEQIREAIDNGADETTIADLATKYAELTDRIQKMESDERTRSKEGFESLSESDIPSEMEAPYYGDGEVTENPFADRDIKEVGKKNVKAYMYENPEVKPFFQKEANYLMSELADTIKGERYYVQEEQPGEYGLDSYGFWTGTKRHTSQDIAYLHDDLGYTYEQIKEGLEDIIEDNGRENNACSKRIEFVINDRLLNGSVDAYGEEMPPDQGYIDLVEAKNITEYNDEAYKQYFESADNSDNIGPTMESDEVDSKTAEILTDEPNSNNKKEGGWSRFVRNFVDKFSVFEKLALKTNNRNLMAKADFMNRSEARAQRFIGKGSDGVRALDDVKKEVERAGLTKPFYDYLYHMHNIDRMSLEERYKNTPNKSVFGDSVTADVSRETAARLEAEHPEFKKWAQDVYKISSHLRKLLVDNGVISQETADLWKQMYPHYVPIRRVGDNGLNVNVPLDTGRTGVNAPVKRAKGGSSDILPLFDTMAMRAEQTFRAIARNSFGVELKNTLGSTIDRKGTNLDEIMDSIDQQEELLKKGENGKKPTFTVFENGNRVTFEITDEMYKALKPTSDELKYRNKVAGGLSKFSKGIITEYNPLFSITNAIKDVQDIIMNSQHARKTYMAIPKAIKEMTSGGRLFQEYMENGGESNTYFDSDSKTFKVEDNAFKKVIGMPVRAISRANNVIEMLPRFAEYIASRESGASVEVAMLDAARVTTNFSAGGDATKFLDRNGATFLNASVQGAAQQVRNVREAKANGFRGWLGLAAKVALAGLPAVLLNHALWGDDDEYEELSDYVKDNYYIIAKYGDGKFVRIPKGRALAVIQNAFEQVSSTRTGNDSVDFERFFDLFMNNIAPNNPIESNIISPLINAATNTTWYGGDLVPTRLQDLPAEEQYDESTDVFSKWLGETFGISPYKANYVIDQYSGGIGDIVLPMLTPEAERGGDTLGDALFAPVIDKFTTDSTMKNQNVTDFYDVKDELTANAKSSKATDEDVLMSKYFNAQNSDLSKLYTLKREIQNSDLTNSEKYEYVREVQRVIDDIAEESLTTYADVKIDGKTATVGDRQYKLNDNGEWVVDNENKTNTIDDVIASLGISSNPYWKEKTEKEFAEKNPSDYAMAKAVGGYDSYKEYTSALSSIKADKDKDGKTVSGSRKRKVLAYINSLDASYEEKIILYKKEYPSEDRYNRAIVEYLNSRDDISYKEMKSILEDLGFKVDSKGNVSW